MRSGFLVTSHRKKLWNVQIGLINEFARICKKYNLRWFACGGTLLGAARHKGFIPWDDDVDLAMFRPDYEKFKQIAPAELKFPYYFDNWYSYRLESDATSSPQDSQLPVLTRRQFIFGQFPSFPLIKIRDSRTSMIEFQDRRNVNQGVWIDIFPFDVLPPFEDKKQAMIFEASRQLLFATMLPQAVRQAMENNQPLLFQRDEMEKFLSLPYSERGARFDNFMAKNFFESHHVGDLREYITTVQPKNNFKTSDFDDIVYLPFEKIELPAPANFDSVLTDQYGNWHKLVFSPGHVKNYSADIPYIEYFKTSMI